MTDRDGGLAELWDALAAGRDVGAEVQPPPMPQACFPQRHPVSNERGWVKEERPQGCCESASESTSTSASICGVSAMNGGASWIVSPPKRT